MLTALLLLAIFFGLVQEVKVPVRFRAVTPGFKGRKNSARRSALVAVTGKTKS